MLRIIKKSIYMIFIFFIALFIGSSFFLRAKYNYFVYGDSPILEKQNLGIFILLIGIITLISIALYRICLLINRYNKKIVIPLTLFISFIIQLCLILAFSRLPTDDSQTVLSLALNMLYNKDYSSFQTGGYLYMFPYNFSIVLYLKSLLFLFPDNYLVIKTFNILFSLVTTLMIYLIYKQLNYKSEKNDYGVLLFSATYIPSMLMSNLIYNDVIATSFLTSAIYFTIKFINKKSIKYIVVSSILLSVGNYFRSIGLIVLVAVVIYILLNILKMGIKKAIVSICLVALIFNIPGWTQNAVLQATHVVNESVNKNSAPVYMWLNMGLNIKRFGFWDERESYNIYQVQGNYKKEKSTGLFKKEIRRKLSSATPVELLNMYYKKLIWTWTEGTYQIDRYGISNQTTNNSVRKSNIIISNNIQKSNGGLNNNLQNGNRVPNNNFKNGNKTLNESAWNNNGSVNNTRREDRLVGGYSYSTFATDIFKGNSEYRSGLLWLLYVINFLMYCFIFIRLIKGLRIKRFDEVFPVLVIMGFIAFYLLWEIKSRYIYPVYPLFIVLSYMGFKDVYNSIIKINYAKYLTAFRKRI